MNSHWNLHWAQSNKYLLVIVVSAVAIDSVLTTLVIGQLDDHNTANERINLPIASPVPAPSIPAPVSAAPQLAPAPQVPTSLTPPLVVSAPQIITPPQQAPAHHTPRKPKTLPPRQANPVPAPPPAPAPPPTNPAGSDTAVKPGAPPELS